MSKVKIVDKDKGYKALVKRVYGMGKPTVSVGILEAEGAQEAAGSNITIAELAAIHEFGLGVPERSFLRAWFDQNEDRARSFVTELLKAVVKGKYSKEQALELLGTKLQAEIQARISAGIDPANAPSTIARKGSATPLIDTGQLRSSMSYKVGSK